MLVPQQVHRVFLIVLQTGLAAAFGFFAALFLALLLAPAIARRVSELTWRQATRVLPQSSEEIAASRDHLRGQNALEMRQLEMKMDVVAEKERQLRIGKQAFEDRIAALGHEVNSQKSMISGLEINKVQLTRDISDAVQTNAMLTTENADRDVRLATLSSEFSHLRDDHARQVAAFGLLQEAHRQTEQRFELTRNEASQLRSKLSGAESELRIARSEAKRQEGDVKLANRKIIALEAKLERSIRSMAEAEEKLERREAELKRLKEHSKPVPVSPLANQIRMPASIAKAVPVKPAHIPVPAQFVPAQSATTRETAHLSGVIVAQIAELRPALRAAKFAKVNEKLQLKGDMMDLAGRVTGEAAAHNANLATKVSQLKPGSALANAILKYNKAAE